MRTEVWKFGMPVKELRDVIKIQMPKRARILHVGNQRESLCFWCMVSPNEKEFELRHFRVAGTGHPIYEDKASLVFVGTVIFMEGDLVFHVFEITDD